MPSSIPLYVSCKINQFDTLLCACPQRYLHLSLQQYKYIWLKQKTYDWLAWLMQNFFTYMGMSRSKLKFWWFQVDFDPTNQLSLVTCSLVLLYMQVNIIHCCAFVVVVSICIFKKAWIQFKLYSRMCVHILVTAKKVFPDSTFLSFWKNWVWFNFFTFLWNVWRLCFVFLY